MKKIFNLVAVGMVLASVNVNAQTYVNEMTQADVELSLIHISEPTRQAEISYAVFCLKKKK